METGRILRPVVFVLLRRTGALPREIASQSQPLLLLFKAEALLGLLKVIQFE